MKLRFTGEVPFLEIYVAENIVNQVMGRSMGGKNMLQLDAPDYVGFLRRTGMDAGYIHAGWKLGRKNKVDETGRVHYVDGTIKSRADFDQIELPSLDPVRRSIEAFLDEIEGTKLGSIYALDEASGLVFTAIGPTDSLTAIFDDPGFVDEFTDRVEEYTLAALEVVLEYPVDALFLTGLRCMNTGPIPSREMHERFILPRIEKMMDIIRSHGVPVFLHSDGDNTAFMEWIIEPGFTALHPIEPSDGSFDIYHLKARYMCKKIGPRPAGSPAISQARKYLGTMWEAIGAVDVREEKVPVRLWDPGEPELELLEPKYKTYNCLQHLYTASQDLILPLADVRNGLPDDFKRSGQHVKGTATASGGHYE